MNSTALDLATLPASPPQRRAAHIAIAVLTVAAVAAAPFARIVVGTFPGFVMLHGGAVIMGLCITATILFAQFALSRKPSLLALACGMLFTTIMYVPYVVTFSGVGTLDTLSARVPNYLLTIWHTLLPGWVLLYVVLGAREGPQRVTPARATLWIIGTVVAAVAATELVFAFSAALPFLSVNGRYRPVVYVMLGAVGVMSASALVMLIRRKERSVLDAWLTVPAAALFLETVLNAFGGARYSIGWYLSRADVLVATTSLVVALLLETNRLARVLAAGQRRLRGIVNGVTDALIVVDARGAVASLNPAAVALFGFPAAGFAGQPITRILPDFASVLDAPEATIVETTGRDAHGGVFPIEVARGRDAARDAAESILIIRDITQRKRAEEAIRTAHDRAIEAVAVKSQFLATMSHEIRTPINAVVGMSELLLQTQLGEEAHEYATTVRDSAESLLAIVNDILDFSQIEAGHMNLDAMPFAPVVALEEATDIVAAAARKKGLSLSTYVAPDVPPRVIGDPDRLRQILLNLIGNAVKFTAAGSVTVRAVVDRNEGDDAILRFSVTDTGVGIASDVGETLFEPFRQADQSTRRRYGGTGLGLSISRRIVELMGGRIGFDSVPGRGATFWFTAPFTRVLDEQHAFGDALRGVRVLVVDEEPVARQVLDQYLLAWGAVASSTGNAAHALELAKAAAARKSIYDVALIDRRAGGDGFRFAARLTAIPGLERVPIVLISGADELADEAHLHGFRAVVRKPIRQVVLHDALVRAVHGARVPSPLPAFATAPTAPREDVLVLIAEDNPVNRKLALQQLKTLGYRAHAVQDGREAIDAVARDAYDLVLMDCQMPDVDGFEATREIRRAEAVRGGHVPIVAMTANALEGDREACLAAGMDDYLAKPVQLAALRALVERFVDGVEVG